MSALIGSEGPQLTCDGRMPPSVLRNCPCGRVSGSSRRPSSDRPGPENARWSGNATTRADGPETRPHRKRVRPSQVSCGPSEPILAEIHQPNTPRDPRNLAMVRCATRHFEQNQQNGGQPFAFLTQFFIHVQIGPDRWDFRTFVQIGAIQFGM